MKKKSFFFVGGPCVIENYEETYKIASILKDMTEKLGISFIFKASYDKANRTSINSFRGPGIDHGLNILSKISDRCDIPVMSDIHRISEVNLAANVLDFLQIPAFLCRQTDLISEIAKTGKPINIKKGQFMAPRDINNVVNKITFAGGTVAMITERGTLFGYNNLIVDFRNIEIMKKTGFPIIFDATHSVQLPSIAGNKSGGERDYVPILAKTAIAAGIDGIFFEVHKHPEMAFCDGPNSIRLNSLANLLLILKNVNL